MEKMPFIGQLDRKVVILRYVKTQSSTGAIRPVEQVVICVFAKMDEKSGDEELDGKIMHVVNRSYTVRYDKGILNFGKDYIVQDGIFKYRIQNVAEIGRKRFLSLKVTLLNE